MSATTKPIKDKIPAQAYLLHTICFLDTGSDTAYFPHFHCSSQVVREIIIDIISIGMSKKLIYIVPLFSNMNQNFPGQRRFMGKLSDRRSLYSGSLRKESGVGKSLLQ